MNDALERSLGAPTLSEHAGRFAIPMPGVSSGLLPQDRALLDRIPEPISLTDLIKTRREIASLDRLVARGLVMISGITPSDACHALNRLKSWNKQAAEKGLQLMARRRTSSGDQLADSAQALAVLIVDQVTNQTSNCVLESAFAEDPAFAGENPVKLAHHTLTKTGICSHKGIMNISASIGVPVIGLGASAATYYPAVGKKIGAKMLLPEHAGVANAIGAVVGQIRQSESGTVTSESEGSYTVHLESGPAYFGNQFDALLRLETELVSAAREKAGRAGAEHVEITITSDIRDAEIEGRKVFVEAEITATATGRPSMARS